MILVREKIDRDSSKFNQAIATHFLSLPFEIRQKSRFIAKLDSGLDIGLQIERGHILRDGDKLMAVDGKVIEIKAGNEAVSTVNVKNDKLIARVCYHLGNRHVQLQVEAGWCRYLQDHVLDEMVELLGAQITHENAPFEPEAGAYAGGHNHPNHGHKSHESSVQYVEAPKSIIAVDGFSEVK